MAFIDDTPKRAVEVTSGLSAGEWRSLEAGLEVIQTRTKTGTIFSAFRISPEKFAFKIGTQEHPKGERAGRIGPRLDAVLVINAGFFGMSKNGKLFPVGLMSSSGVPSGKAWRTSGGYLVFGKRTLIRPSDKGLPVSSGEFVQSKPVLIEPGGRWAMNTNSKIRKKRSLFCLQRDGKIIISLVTGAGLSLYESGWLLRSPKDGGYFDCDSAIAMDGGGSTQTWVKGHPELSYRGISPVHNFLIMQRK
ncbi:MAG: phosphodiester glycosidase family protein [Rhizobiaceae bacterium]|nr:phosphodiester glycosidase family protein [Rhizobiaceae bacterium]